VAAVEVAIGFEVVGDLQSGFFEADKCTAAGQQFGFERALASLSVGIIIRVVRPAIAGQCLGLLDARPVSLASVIDCCGRRG